MRLDLYVAEEYQITRSRAISLIKDGCVLVNGIVQTKAGYELRSGDSVKADIPAPVPTSVEAQEIPLRIIYQDQDLAVVFKPSGMVVHPAAGHYSGTLVNALMYHCRDSLSGINGVMRPGIVHRIDKDTTGSLIICKNDNSHEIIAEQLKEHSIVRKYRAICMGILKEDEYTINAPIGRHPIERKKMAINDKNGKHAVTHVKVLKRLKNATYIECRLETGRTHQIRVHLSSLGHPLLGDEVYGDTKNKYKLNGQTLHAYILGFIHPKTEEYIETIAPLPLYFEKLLKTLEN